MVTRSTKPIYLCPTKKKGKRCGNRLRPLMVSHLDSALLDPSYLRYCDKCHSIFVLVPEWVEPKFIDIPFLEDPELRLDQMEVIA